MAWSAPNVSFTSTRWNVLDLQVLCGLWVLWRCVKKNSIQMLLREVTLWLKLPVFQQTLAVSCPDGLGWRQRRRELGCVCRGQGVWGCRNWTPGLPGRCAVVSAAPALSPLPCLPSDSHQPNFWGSCLLLSLWPGCLGLWGKLRSATGEVRRQSLGLQGSEEGLASFSCLPGPLCLLGSKGNYHSKKTFLLSEWLISWNDCIPNLLSLRW